jgi:D-glycero-D-manno-heptose 1,7-bisphosphate phosphatase
MPSKRKVVFLDRDGTLIHDRPGHYLLNPEGLRFYKNTFAALRLLKKAGYKLVVITNQSGLGRGLLTRPTLKRIHKKMHAALKRAGASVDAVYFCPHHPKDGCRCRKPSTLLARKALRDKNLTLQAAAVVGDKKADIDLGRALGVAALHLECGHGRQQRERYGKSLRATARTRDILGAAKWIVRNLGMLALFLLPLQSHALPITAEHVKTPQDLVGKKLAYEDRYKKLGWFPEKLTFEVKYGIFAMGEATLEMEEIVEFNGRPAYHIVSRARTSKFADKFYKVRDINESWLDAEKMRSLGYSKKLREGNFFRDEWVVYDYPKNSWLSKRVNRDGSFQYSSSNTLRGSVQDILSSLYFIRPGPLKVGDVVTLDVNTKSTWPLAIKVLKRRTIKVPAGRFRCILVEPYLREEGIFIQKGKSMRLWLTDDERHMPVLLQVEIIFGHISAYLKNKPQ